MSAIQQYIDIFNSCRGQIDAQCPKAVSACRQGALELLQEKGLPTLKDEAYRYHDIDGVFAPDYGINIGRLKESVKASEVFSCDVPNMGTSVFFQVNDSFCTEYPSNAFLGLPEELFIGSLRQFDQKYPGMLERYYGRLSAEANDGVTALNTLLVQDGMVIYAPKGVQVTKPIQVVNVLESLRPRMANRRFLVILEEGAMIRLLLCDHTMDETDYLSTQVMEAYVASSASLELYELEENSSHSHRISNLYIHQESSSTVRHNQITLSNGFTRNGTHAVLNGEDASLHLYGMAIADDSQIVDNRTYVQHARPRCQSEQLYKFVLGGQARGAFSGLVKVDEGAHHSVSTQTNRNLCSTKEAHMFTQPQLEIYNDDVKCSHGATVGQLDEAALFYMRQRGIPMEQARMLLKLAFVTDVVDSIPLEALRTRLHYLVEKRFKGELNKGCAACRMCKGTELK